MYTDKKNSQTKISAFSLTLPLVSIFLWKTCFGNFFLIWGGFHVSPGYSVSHNDLSINIISPVLFSNHFALLFLWSELCPLPAKYLCCHFSCKPFDPSQCQDFFKLFFYVQIQNNRENTLNVWRRVNKLSQSC